jgi:CRISPR-associated protein Cst2
MANHLFGAVVTPHGIASNNRGENEGNITTLQKILWNGEVYTTVSAEAIRWAMRLRWQQRDLPLNRVWLDERNRNRWEDLEFKDGGRSFIDDDVLGYMHPDAAKQSGTKGSAAIRRSRFEVTRAVSLTAWPGDVVFNAASINATPGAQRRGEAPAPYGAEVHATRFQYGFAMTPESLHHPERTLAVIDAIVDLGNVAGNHARYFFDFSPDTVIFRWSEDFAPRMLYPFALDSGGALTIPGLLRRIEAGDVDPLQLIVGGSLAGMPDGDQLKSLGASVFLGVKSATNELKQRMKDVVKE